MRFEILGQVRGGKNNITVTRSGHRVPTKTFATWAKASIHQVMQQRADDTIDVPCRLDVVYWPGDLRTRDIPAVVDAVMHVSEKAEVVSNDKLFQRLHYMQQRMDRKNPRIRIDITRVGENDDQGRTTPTRKTPGGCGRA